MGVQKGIGGSSTPKKDKKKPISEKDSHAVCPVGDPRGSNQIVAPLPSLVDAAFLQRAVGNVTTDHLKDGEFSRAGDAAEQVESTGAPRFREIVPANVAPESIDTLTSLGAGVAAPGNSSTLPTGAPDMKAVGAGAADNATQDIYTARAFAAETKEVATGAADNGTQDIGSLDNPTIALAADDAQAWKTRVQEAAPTAAAADDVQQSPATRNVPPRLAIDATTTVATATGVAAPRNSPTLPTGTPEMIALAAGVADNAIREIGPMDKPTIAQRAPAAGLPFLPPGSVRASVPTKTTENSPAAQRNVSQPTTLQKPGTDLAATMKPGIPEEPEEARVMGSAASRRVVNDDAPGLNARIQEVAPVATATDDDQKLQITRTAPPRLDVGGTSAVATDAAASTTASVPTLAAAHPNTDKLRASTKEPETPVTASAHLSDVKALAARESASSQSGADFTREAFTSSDRPSTTTPLERTVNTAHLINTMQRSEVSVGIRTEGLGSVQVHAAMQGNRLGAVIVADHAGVQHALGSQMSNLEHALRQHDLDLQQLSLNRRSSGDVFDPGTGRQQSEAEEHRFRSSLPATPSTPMRRASDEEPNTSPQSSAGLNLHA